MFLKPTAPPTNQADPFKDFPIKPSDYGDAGIEDSLVKLYEAAISHADRRIKWYDDKADAARWVSRRLRSGSLIFFALGTIAPIASNIFAGIAATIIQHVTGAPDLTGPMERVSVSDVGYIFLALAGGLVVFDQFFEYTASWTRYRQSQARLERLRADLRYTWASRMAATMHSQRTVICGPGESNGATPPPSTTEGTESGGTEAAKTEGAQAEGAKADRPGIDECAVVQLVEILRTFVNAIEQLAETETVEWAERFRARVQAFDEQALRAGRNGAPPGGTPPGGTGATNGAAPDGGAINAGTSNGGTTTSSNTGRVTPGAG